MRATETNTADPQATALAALAWTLGDDERARRLLALTGLDPADLRARAGEPAVLGASLDFLLNNERDLVACADALGIAPAALAAVRERLGA